MHMTMYNKENSTNLWNKTDQAIRLSKGRGLRWFQLLDCAGLGKAKKEKYNLDVSIYVQSHGYLDVNSRSLERKETSS